MSDEAVEAKTGRDWKSWVDTLDKVGAATMPHPEIAQMMHEKWGVPGWWAQMVTVGYEQARGLREKHQKPDGFSISGSKTVGVPVAELFRAWKDKRRRTRWLGDIDLRIRKSTPEKSMRLDWSDGRTSLSVNFYAKGTGKSHVTLQHEKLPNARAAERMKTAVKALHLDRIQSYGFLDVLQFGGSEIGRNNAFLVLDVAIDNVGHGDGSRFGHPLDSGGEIHPVTKYVAARFSHFTKMDPDAELKITLFPDRALELSCAVDCL